MISLIFAISSSAWAGDYDVDIVSPNSEVLYFYPISSQSIGYVSKLSIPPLTTIYDKVDDTIKAGMVSSFPLHKIRGYLRFGLSNFPSNVCIQSVKIRGYCYETSQDATHTLRLHMLEMEPFMADAESLYNAIDTLTSFTYNSCSSCMSQTGFHTVDLGVMGVFDFENHLYKEWFAVGLTEDGENDSPGIWYGYDVPIEDKRVRLEVEVDYIPYAPTVTINPDTVCVDSQFCISWDEVYGASYYKVMEGSNPWVNVGNITQYCINKDFPGDFTYYVRAFSPCGSAWDQEGVPVTVTPCSCCTGITGNVDGSGDNQIDIADIVYFIDYSFNLPPGPAPPCMEEADVNGDSVIDIEDIVYLIDYAFNLPSGPEPVACP
ncbi:MAG: dockerin type I repeat-containing protein [Candidatus Zixiibacteriota bacterium]